MSFARRTILTVSAALCLAAAAAAQEQKTALYGRVVGSDQRGAAPAGWIVRVTAKREGTDDILDQRDSSRELYCVRVPANARVRLFFETTFRPTADHLGYVSRRMPRAIDTSPADRREVYRPVPDVTLEQRVQRAGINARAEAQGDLEADVTVARETRSLDILTATVARYRAAYSKDSQVLADIDRTAGGVDNVPEFKRLRTPEYDQRLDLLRQVETWRQQQQQPGALDTKSLMALAQDGTVFSDIRSEAMLTLASQADTANASSDVIAFLRQQAAAGAFNLMLPAFTALAKVGTAADKQAIIRSVGGDDPERALAAIGEARMMQGAPALSALLRVEVNPMLEQFAARSLANLAQARDRTAITGLKEAATQDKDPAVRIEAVEALGAVISVDADARRVVQEVQKKDSSAEVRRAATVTLARDRP